MRVCQIIRYIPEIRLPDLASQNQKQHDGNFLLPNGDRTGIEVEAFDRKSGDKLARFAAQCLNSITNNRVQRVLVLVQTESALQHYSKPFLAGQEYCPQWTLHKGKWYPVQSSKTQISKELSGKVSVKLMLTEAELKDAVACMPTIYLPSALDDEDVLD